MKARVAAAVLLAGLLLGSAVGPVMARTSVSVNASVTCDDVTVTVTVDKKPKAIASCTYSVDSASPVSCGERSAFGSKATRYRIDLTDMSVGDHSISVRVRLTDGGTGSGSTSFTIAGPRVFVNAYTNLDGQPGFGPTDQLIARFVDSNGDDAISVGDTVEIGTFPGDLDNSSRITPGVPSHVITNVGVISSGAVLVATPTSEFYWSMSTGGYTESESGASSWVQDQGDGTCRLGIEQGSPSKPASFVPAVLDSCFDLVDLSFDVP